MWVQDNARTEIDIMNEARNMRDEAIGRYVSAAAHGIANFVTRLLHAGQAHPRTN